MLHTGNINIQKVHEIEQWKGILLGGKVTRKSFQEEMNERGQNVQYSQNNGHDNHGAFTNHIVTY